MFVRDAYTWMQENELEDFNVEYIYVWFWVMYLIPKRKIHLGVTKLA